MRNKSLFRQKKMNSFYIYHVQYMGTEIESAIPPDQEVQNFPT